jgi:hypothetical protein
MFFFLFYFCFLKCRFLFFFFFLFSTAQSDSFLLLFPSFVFLHLFLVVIAGLCERVALLLGRQRQQRSAAAAATQETTTITTTQQPTKSTKGCTCSETLNTVQIQYKYIPNTPHTLAMVKKLN